MTDSRSTRVRSRRAHVVREILDAAWSFMAEEGVAVVSVREVARSVGLRQQSLTYYFPTKQSLLDALFADGFSDLARVFERLPSPDDPIQGVVDVAVAFVDHCVAQPARYHLMFQRTIPGFEPSPESIAVTQRTLGVLQRRLVDAGVTDAGDVAVIRCMISGLVAEQTANDPGGRFFADQTGRAIRVLLGAMVDQPRDQARA